MSARRARAETRKRSHGRGVVSEAHAVRQDSRKGSVLTWETATEAPAHMHMANPLTYALDEAKLSTLTAEADYFPIRSGDAASRHVL